MKTKIILRTAASIIGIMIATATQAAPAADTASAAPEGEATAVADVSVAEIIVTARRRAESLQDVPIAVTVLSGVSLTRAGINDAMDLGSAVPSLSISTTGNSRSQPAYAIRGQRTNETQILTDPPVGLYFAEVNQPRTAGFGNAFYDIQSFQVLKGVQGTLFGRNMTGGAILVEPNHPTDDFAGLLRAQYGNYDMRDLEGMINVPLGDVGALRVAAKMRRRDGYMIDISNGRDYNNHHYDAFRASLRLNPTDNIENLTIFDYIRADEHGIGPAGDFASLVFNGPAGPNNVIGNYSLYNLLNSLGVPGFAKVSDVAGQIAAQTAIRDSGNPYRFLGTSIGAGGAFDYPVIGGGVLPHDKVKNWGITNKTTIELGDITLKNIFGYRKIETDVIQDLDGLPAPLISAQQFKDIKEVSEELQLQGKVLDDRLNYTFGVYYFQEQGDDGNISQQFPELSTGRGAPNTPSARLTGTDGGGKSTTYAGFAAATYALSEQFKVSGGVRYTHDRREIRNRTLGAPNLTGCTFDTRGLDGIAGTADDVPITADCTVKAAKSWSDVTWDATLQWEPSRDTTAYISTRRGFRAGVFSLRATNALALQPADPETVQEYEVGLKNRFDLGGGVLSTSLALFRQDYKDVQKQVLTTVVIGGTPIVVTRIANVAKERITGGEFEANLRVGNIDFGASYSYVHVKVLKSDPSLANDFAVQGVPSNQVNTNLAWHLPVDDSIGELTLSGNLSLKSDQHLDNNDLGGNEDGYAIANLRAQWDNIGGSRISAAAFVNNVTNTLYRIGVIGIVAETGIGASIYGEPRTYGMEVSYKF